MGAFLGNILDMLKTGREEIEATSHRDSHNSDCGIKNTKHRAVTSVWTVMVSRSVRSLDKIFILE